MIVVGYDGSASSLSAVRFAATEAKLRDTSLKIVHAFVWDYMVMPVPFMMVSPDTAREAMRVSAETMMSEVSTFIKELYPDLAVDTLIIDGFAASTLIDQSSEADMLVVGDRGLGAISGILVGAVAVQASQHATCPVAVVRGESISGPIIAAVDTRDTSVKILEFAFKEAQLRKAELIVIHTWLHPESSLPGDMLSLVYDPDQLEQLEQEVFNAALEGWQERFPDVSMRSELIKGRTSKILVERSKTAQLLVVGSRGRGGFSGLLFGSVSQKLIYHSHCPVVIAEKSINQVDNLRTHL